MHVEAKKLFNMQKYMRMFIYVRYDKNKVPDSM